MHNQVSNNLFLAEPSKDEMDHFPASRTDELFGSFGPGSYSHHQ